MKDGDCCKTVESRRHTLADLVDRYPREVLPYKPRDPPNTTLHLDRCQAKLGRYLLSDVTAGLVVQYRIGLLATETHRGRPMSTSTVVRYMRPHLVPQLVEGIL